MSVFDLPHVLFAALRTAFMRSFVWRGRAGRLEFWTAFAAQSLVETLFTFGARPGLLFAGAALSLAMVPMVVSAAVRRLHDRDLSGGWLAGLMVLLALALLSPALDPSGTVGFVAGVAGLVAFVALLVQLVLPGTLGPNRFGAPAQ